MNRFLLGIVAMAGIATASQAANTLEDGHTAGVQVDSIPAMTRLHRWEAVNERALIVWATPFQPYLVELQWPSQNLHGARTISLSSYASRISARSDAVTVEGLAYPISRIYRLTRDEVRDETFTW